MINIPEPLVSPDSAVSELKKVINFVITVMNHSFTITVCMLSF
jgi:hypothetical protein